MEASWPNCEPQLPVVSLLHQSCADNISSQNLPLAHALFQESGTTKYYVRILQETPG